jgi:phosphopantetheinyl transferase
MPLLKKIEIGNGILLLWEMTESAAFLVKTFPEALTDPVFNKISSPKRQQEWLAVRGLIKAAGCRPEQLSYFQTGQPRIDHPDYNQISISHSDKLAGLFLHEKYPVGLDIENSKRNFLRVEGKYLSPGERILAHAIPNGHGLFWCIKEAVFKAAGIPGIFFAEQICISLNSESRLTATLRHNAEHRFIIHSLELGEQLIVCVIAENHKLI